MPLDVFDFTLPFPPHMIVWVVFGCIMLAFGIVSLILLYHWKTYKLTSVAPSAIVATFFLVAAVPIAIMLVAALKFSFV